MGCWRTGRPGVAVAAHHRRDHRRGRRDLYPVRRAPRQRRPLGRGPRSVSCRGPPALVEDRVHGDQHPAVSGLYNFFMINSNFRGELPRWYHPLFGVKFILAMAVFAIASLLAGRTPLAQRMRTQDEVLAVAESAVGRADHRDLGRDANGAPASSAGRGGTEPVKAVAQADPDTASQQQGQFQSSQR